MQTVFVIQHFISRDILIVETFQGFSFPFEGNVILKYCNYSKYISELLMYAYIFLKRSLADAAQWLLIFFKFS